MAEFVNAVNFNLAVMFHCNLCPLWVTVHKVIEFEFFYQMVIKSHDDTVATVLMTDVEYNWKT